MRVQFLGRKAELPNLLRGVAELPPEQRGAVGKAANEARKALEAQIDAKAGELAVGELNARLEQDRVDVTLPADPLPAIGRLHLITQTRREIEDVFIGLGYNVAEGPEVETRLLQLRRAQPRRDASRARLDRHLLRHTTTCCCARTPARCRSARWSCRSRRSTSSSRAASTAATPTSRTRRSSTRSRDSRSTRASRSTDLKGTLLEFARAIFGPEREIRLRPHFFPFTEPSVEVDVSCFNCTGGITADGERCGICKGTGWIEILGSGMVDPNVLLHVKDNGYDPEQVQGFAFGMGIERIAMLKHGVTDLRLFYDNDVRFLEQFA